MKSLFKSFMRMYRSGGYYNTKNEHGCLSPRGHQDALFLFGDPENYRHWTSYKIMKEEV